MTSYAMLQFDRISLNADVNLIVYHSIKSFKV